MQYCYDYLQDFECYGCCKTSNCGGCSQDDWIPISMNYPGEANCAARTNIVCNARIEPPLHPDGPEK